MRWTRNDTLAYQAITDAGDKLRGLWDDHQAGKAYEEGAGQGAVDPDEYRKLAERFQADNPEAAAAYTRAAEAGYAVPSASDRRTAGLQSQGDFWMRRGNATKANALYDQVDQMQTRGLQRQMAQRQLGKMERDEADETKFRKITDEIAALRPRLNDADPKKRLEAWQELTQKHSGSDWGGRTFSKVEGYGQDGSLYAYVANPDTGKVMPVNLSDPAIQDKILNAYAMHQMRGVSPQAMQAWMQYDQGQAREAGQQRRHEQTLARYDADRESRENIARMHYGALGKGGGLSDTAGYREAVGKYNAFIASDEYQNALDSGDRKQVQSAQRKANALAAVASTAAGRPLQMREPADERATKGMDPKQRQEIIKLVRENNPNFDALPRAAQDDLIADAFGLPMPALKLGPGAKSRDAQKGGSKGTGTQPQGFFQGSPEIEQMLYGLGGLGPEERARRAREESRRGLTVE